MHTNVSFLSASSSFLCLCFFSFILCFDFFTLFSVLSSRSSCWLSFFLSSVFILSSLDRLSSPFFYFPSFFYSISSIGSILLPLVIEGILFPCTEGKVGIHLFLPSHYQASLSFPRSKRSPNLAKHPPGLLFLQPYHLFRNQKSHILIPQRQ